MDTKCLIIAIFGTAIGVFALVLTHAQYCLGRRRTVRVSVTKTSLVRSGAATQDLEIRVRRSGKWVTDPYSLTLSLAARRPSDVPMDAFAGRPLRIAFGTPVASLIAVEGHPDGEQIVEDWHEENRYQSGPWATEEPLRYIDLPPALLSVTQPWTVTALFDGEPDPKIAGQLANVDFLPPADIDRASRRLSAIGFAGDLLVLAFFSWVALGDYTKLAPGLFGVASLAFGALGALAIRYVLRRIASSG